MLGGLVGGIIVTATNTSIYAISMGITGFPAFIDQLQKHYWNDLDNNRCVSSYGYNIWSNVGYL